jgi:hypothetical protein
MRSTSDLLLLSGLSAGALLVGLVLCFLGFTSLPLYWGIGLAGAFVLCALVATARRRSPKPAVYAVIAVIFTIAFTGVVAAPCWSCRASAIRRSLS